MNQPRKPADHPAKPDPGETPPQHAPDGQGEADPKGTPTPDRHDTETAAS